MIEKNSFKFRSREALEIFAENKSVCFSFLLLWVELHYEQLVTLHFFLGGGGTGLHGLGDPNLSSPTRD